MCGAYTLFHDLDEIAERFEAPVPDDEPTVPRYKVSPSEAVNIVRLGREGNRKIDSVQWGLVPFWAKDAAIGRKMINARSEQLGEKFAFKYAVAMRRCLIPADGFYEWNHETKQPMYFRRKDGQLFAFAGLWETWRGGDKQGPPMRSCTIVTTEANDTVGKVHDRMPVILLPEEEAIWLGWGGEKEGAPTPQELRHVLHPYPDDLMESYWVSKRVSSRGEHGPEAIEPADIIVPGNTGTLPLPL